MPALTRPRQKTSTLAIDREREKNTHTHTLLADGVSWVRTSEQRNGFQPHFKGPSLHLRTFSEHRFNDFRDLFNSGKRRKNATSVAPGATKGPQSDEKNNSQTLPLQLHARTHTFKHVS